MNIEGLKRALDRKGIKPIYYSLNGIRGDLEDGTSIIENQEGKWMYYYFERGGKFNIKYFNTENEACKYLYELLIRDPNTKIFNPPNK